MKRLNNFLEQLIVLFFGITLLVTSAANRQMVRGQHMQERSLAVVSFGATVQGGDFWQKKDYRQWNEAECRKMLENSPWAAVYPIGSVSMEVLRGGRNSTSPNDLNHENTPRVEYHVQIRSALPIRQAVVRQALIKQKYDQMTPDQKKAIDQQTEKYLAGNYQDRIALYVGYGANIKDDDTNLATYWQKQTTDLLK